jgi:hypothetical protein
VCTWTETSGNAALAGRELPEADVIAASRRIAAQARWLHDRGAPGRAGQLRAAVYTALLLGRPVASLLPPAAGPVDADSPLAAEAGPPVTGTVQLTMPLEAWAALASRPGEIAGHGPAPAGTCRDLAAALAAQPGTRYCLTLTTPGGQPLAHACAPRGHSPPPGLAALAWAASLVPRIQYLPAGACDHRYQSAGYRPSRTLAHLMKIRTPGCIGPGCAQPARHADLDHTIAWHRGGRTCMCNLGSLCRHNHRMKQAPGWHLDQPTPGTYTWTTPHHRTYQVQPHRYPV